MFKKLLALFILVGIFGQLNSKVKVVNRTPQTINFSLDYYLNGHKWVTISDIKSGQS